MTTALKLPAESITTAVRQTIQVQTTPHGEINLSTVEATGCRFVTLMQAVGRADPNLNVFTKQEARDGLTRLDGSVNAHQGTSTLTNQLASSLSAHGEACVFTDLPGPVIAKINDKLNGLTAPTVYSDMLRDAAEEMASQYLWALCILAYNGVPFNHGGFFSVFDAVLKEVAALAPGGATSEIREPTFVASAGPGLPDIVRIPKDHVLQSWLGGKSEAIIEIPYKVLTFIILRAVELAEDAEDLIVGEVTFKLTALMAFLNDIISSGFKPRRLPARGKPEVYAAMVATQLEAFLQSRRTAISTLKQAHTSPTPGVESATMIADGSESLWNIVLRDLAVPGSGRLSPLADILALVSSPIQVDLSAGPIVRSFEQCLTMCGYDPPTMSAEETPGCLAEAFKEILPPPTFRRTIPTPGAPSMVTRVIQNWMHLYEGGVVSRRVFKNNVDLAVYEHIGFIVQGLANPNMDAVITLCQGLIDPGINELSGPVLMNLERRLEPLQHLLRPDLLEDSLEARVDKIIRAKEATTSLQTTS